MLTCGTMHVARTVSSRRSMNSDAPSGALMMSPEWRPPTPRRSVYDSQETVSESASSRSADRSKSVETAVSFQYTKKRSSAARRRPGGQPADPAGPRPARRRRRHAEDVRVAQPVAGDARPPAQLRVEHGDQPLTGGAGHRPAGVTGDMTPAETVDEQAL